jgi:hypothetical protein
LYTTSQNGISEHETRNMKRARPAARAWTPNQIVAYNVSRARLMRDWTQDQAAEAIEPYLGHRLSNASFSALERSVDGGRIREFSADEIFAFARGFKLPIGWFFTPPSAIEDIGIAVPDVKKGWALDPRELLDAVLGTDGTLTEWRSALMTWPLPHSKMRVYKDGRTENLGRVDPDVHQRVDSHVELMAQLLIRERFGDLDATRATLQEILRFMEQLAEPEVGPAPNTTKRAGGKP